MHAFTIAPLKAKFVDGRWSYKALSEKVGYSQAHLCDLFNGKYQPRVDCLINLCEFFNVSPRSCFINSSPEQEEK